MTGTPWWFSAPNTTVLYHWSAPVVQDSGDLVFGDAAAYSCSRSSTQRPLVAAVTVASTDAAAEGPAARGRPAQGRSVRDHAGAYLRPCPAPCAPAPGRFSCSGPQRFEH